LQRRQCHLASFLQLIGSCSEFQGDPFFANFAKGGKVLSFSPRRAPSHSQTLTPGAALFAPLAKGAGFDGAFAFRLIPFASPFSLFALPLSAPAPDSHFGSLSLAPPKGDGVAQAGRGAPKHYGVAQADPAPSFQLQASRLRISTDIFAVTTLLPLIAFI
jgi:hypothetical protein